MEKSDFDTSSFMTFLAVSNKREVKSFFREIVGEVVDEKLKDISLPKLPKTEFPKFLTRAEVSRALGITLPTVDSYAQKGILPNRQKIGTRVLFPEESVLRALQDMPVKFSRR